MTQRFRFPHALGGEETATVTRVAGDHELDGPDQHRRYQLTLPESVAWHGSETSAGVSVERSTGTRATVVVPDGVGFATVRLRVDDTTTALQLPDPTIGAACTAAVRGDETTAPVLLDAVDTAVELPFRVGAFLGVNGTCSLLDTVTRANETASDDVHAHRFDLVRGATLTPNGLPVADADAFERYVQGLDAIDAIGDLSLLDALGDLVAGHPTPRRALDAITDLGFTLADLEARDDNWFQAVVFANAVHVGGLDAARHVAGERAGDAPDYATVKDRAMNAGYWNRDAAWRRVVPAAARQSRHEFGYALANALYWTGEVTRTDSRVDELFHDAAATVAQTIGLDWVAGHARFERERAAGHRHRSARNHERAVSHFHTAEAVAGDYDFLDAWDPVYSRTIVRSNAHSRAGKHAAAIDVLQAGLDEIDALDPPDHRREEITQHLNGQRRERLAILAADRDDQSTLRDHLENARRHYDAIDFERSVERIDRKLEDADGGTDTEGGREDFDARPPPIAPPRGDTGPGLDDIPDLHDFLTGSDPTAVGSVDPGVVPDRPGPVDDPGVDDWR